MHLYAIIEEFARFDTVTFYTLRGEESVLSETDDFFDLFRPERICIALPPKRKYLDETIDLRLYCHWVSKNVVILFNGGIKTANFAQDCPNVSRHFYNAQSWAKQLIEIGIETDGPAITNIEELYVKY